MRALLNVLVVLIVFVAVAVIGLRIVASTGSPPEVTGLDRDGELFDCPDNDSCISSYSDSASDDELVDAFPLQGSGADSIQRVKNVLEGHSKTDYEEGEPMDRLMRYLYAEGELTIETETDSYLYATFEVPVAGFVDDLEFYADEAGGALHVRSASRLNTDPMGINRARLELIRAEYAAGD